MNDRIVPSKDTLERIIREIPTPFHLYDEAALVRRMRALNGAFAWNAGFREYFAVKATPNPHLLQLMKAEGLGADCASLTELMLARAVGFSGEEIMFSSNETPAEEYRLARSLDATINLDDITHIDFLKENGGIPERICLRYNPGGDYRVANRVMGNPGEAKYGMTRAQVVEAVRRLTALGTKRFALHAFLVSNAIDPAYYPGMARLLMELAIDVHRETGAEVYTVNLSGGVGIPYRPEERPVDIAQVGAGVKAAYDELIAGTALEGLRIATELGRWLTGPVGCLITRAIHEKHTHKEYIGVDASACDLMRPAMYGAYHHITVAGKEDAPADHTYDVVGSLCENNDKFAVDRQLPPIERGDLLIIHDTGAHGRSMGYNYNGKLRSGEVLLKADGSFKLIRRAETPEDYFATLDYPGLTG
ncbi:diaminopimelate decarboxylase family protein [Bacillota bacterium Meth-B3]|nr:diaminopimelate decarboxylase [Christensenellaceae bacterium]